VISQGVWIVWGSKTTLSHRQSQSPLTEGWRYLEACDYYAAFNASYVGHKDGESHGWKNLGFEKKYSRF